MRNKLLLGLRLTDLDVPTAACAIAERPADAPFGYVVTPNADIFVRLSRNPEMHAVFEGAWMRLLDSRVVARASALLGLDAPRVVPGSDLTAELMRHHVRPDERITVIGLRPEFVPKLVANTGIAWPHHHNPPMGFDRDPAQMREAVEFVLAHPTRLVFIALGLLRAERLAAAIQATGRATGLALCIGASLDFLSGAEPRAPRWMQRAGLEWFHRLRINPRRMAQRYILDDPPVFGLLLREKLAQRVWAGAADSAESTSSRILARMLPRWAASVRAR